MDLDIPLENTIQKDLASHNLTVTKAGSMKFWNYMIMYQNMITRTISLMTFKMRSFLFGAQFF